MNRSDLKFLVVIFTAFAAVIAFIVVPKLEFRGTEVVELLPESATEIQEYNEWNGLHPDMLYAMRAKISHEDFERVAAKLCLTESEMEYDVHQITEWWRLERTRCKTLYRLEGEPSSHDVVAAWQEGYFYFVDSHGY